MANASVEKLKALGMRHGEKFVVGLAATAFFVLVARAVTLPVLDTKPEQLKSAASQAESNLQAKQDDKDILTKLEADGVVDPGFAKMVDNQVSNALKPGDYKVRLDWVTPEPGAGLIRDQPELVAPTELAAFPGRGGILMYALDAKGERILDTGDAAKTAKGGRRSGRGMPGMGMGMGMDLGMGGPGANGALPGERPEDTQKRLAAEVAKRTRTFAGKVDPAREAKEKEKEKELAAQSGLVTPDPVDQGPWKEETKGKRWITITGVIDNEQMNKNWLTALKNPAIAFPNYRRVDVERQVRQTDGSWGEWAVIDLAKNYEVIDNLPEVDPDEFVPETKRPASLVDPLPFLRAGYWTGVHVARLVPAEVREVPKADANKNAGMGMGMGMAMGMPGAPSRPGGPGSLEGLGGGSGRPGKLGGSMPGMAGAADGLAGMAGPGMGMGMGMGPGSGSGDAGGPIDEPVVPNYEPTLMIRTIDFTVEADTIYRFRARVVVVNPNKDHTDVNPGVETENKELLGPWSEPTDAVTVPADVVSFAQAPEASARRNDLVSFQVVKWDPGTGQTVVKNDDAGPGWIIGDYGNVQMPSAEGPAKPAMIDFNSRAIVLDMMGGRERIPDIGIDRNAYLIPAVAMVIEPDGSVVIRSQATDKADEVRQDMENNYKQALEDSGKDRPPGASSGRAFGSGSMMMSGGGGGRKKRGR